MVHPHHLILTAHSAIPLRWAFRCSGVDVRLRDKLIAVAIGATLAVFAWAMTIDYLMR